MRILALSPSHDSSVAVYSNGQIEFFGKEERFTGYKRDGYPFTTLEKAYDLFKGKIDHATYSWLPDDCHRFEIFHAYLYKRFKLTMAYPPQSCHHLNHAALAFYNSGFEEALTFVIDRNGSWNENKERESETVFKCSYPHTFQTLYKSYWSHQYPTFGIVRVYEAATTLMGQGALENGKAMGLASYGKNKKYDKLFVGHKALHDKFEETNNEWGSAIFKGQKDKIEKDITLSNYQFYADAAKHVQIETQKAALSLIKKYVKKTGIKNICLVGGYALNVVANSFFIKNLPDCNFYIEPVSDDTGTSLGAAMILYRHETKDKNIYNVPNNFYHYYKNSKEQYGVKKSIKDLCNILNNQKILALFEGAPESGPRALGHRSLLFDPRNSLGKKIVNSLKNREWYRPFAGVILEEKFQDYFETLGLKESPYMTLSFKCKPMMKKQFPSIVHVDNTCRVQTVKDGFLYELLKEFYKKTGCPFLLNTSFNTAGNPLIHTKKDAVKFVDNCNNPSFEGVYFVEDKKLYKSN